MFEVFRFRRAFVRDDSLSTPQCRPAWLERPFTQYLIWYKAQPLVQFWSSRGAALGLGYFTHMAADALSGSAMASMLAAVGKFLGPFITGHTGDAVVVTSATDGYGLGERWAIEMPFSYAYEPYWADLAPVLTTARYTPPGGVTSNRQLQVKEWSCACSIGPEGRVSDEAPLLAPLCAFPSLFSYAYEGYLARDDAAAAHVANPLSAMFVYAVWQSAALASGRTRACEGLYFWIPRGVDTQHVSARRQIKFMNANSAAWGMQGLPCWTGGWNAASATGRDHVSVLGRGYEETMDSFL
jgi:hypothetical protein